MILTSFRWYFLFLNITPNQCKYPIFNVSVAKIVQNCWNKGFLSLKRQQISWNKSQIGLLKAIAPGKRQQTARTLLQDIPLLYSFHLVPILLGAKRCEGSYAWYKDRWLGKKTPYLDLVFSAFETIMENIWKNSQGSFLPKTFLTLERAKNPKKDIKLPYSSAL